MKKRTGLSNPGLRLNWKSGSAMQSCSGRLHVRLPFCAPESVVAVHRGNCLLYAMLTEQPDPTPVDLDTELQVANSMSSVPSRSVHMLNVTYPND